MCLWWCFTRPSAFFFPIWLELWKKTTMWSILAPRFNRQCHFWFEKSETRTKELWLWDELACLMCVYRITSCSGLNISNSVKLARGSLANFSFNLLVFTKSDLINRKGSSKEKMPIFSSVFCNRWIFPSSHPWCQFGGNYLPFSGLLLLPRLPRSRQT